MRRLLTAEDVADRWRVKPSQVYRMVRGGQLDGVVVRIGRYYRFPVAALERFERDGGTHAG